jgi:hypothetical protein
MTSDAVAGSGQILWEDEASEWMASGYLGIMRSGAVGGGGEILCEDEVEYASVPLCVEHSGTSSTSSLN